MGNSKMSQTQEFNFSQKIISPEDLNKILVDLRPETECVISFSDAEDANQDFDSLRAIFRKIVDTASKVVLIAAPGFEVLGQGCESGKLHFVNKPSFSFSTVQGNDFDTVFVSLIESFWAHYFPKIKQVPRAIQASFSAQAAVTLMKTNKNYWLALRMSEEGLKAATDKILQFPVDGKEFYPPGDLVAEILNILCGLLKPLMRLRKFEIQVEVGIPTELPPLDYSKMGPNVHHWSFEIGPNSYFDIELNEEVNHVST